ncbi:MAG: cation:proton antiporter [Oscillospiraceae bacterium]|nr:cation:proton antiporter [Oscillospiraceae bacterium]
MATLLSLSVAALAGLLLTRLLRPLRLPDVTAYIIAGVLVGPYCLGSLGVPGLGFAPGDTEKFSLICDVALGFIAFSIGKEMRLRQLRKTGRQATFIGVVQALTAGVLVDLALLIVHAIRPDVLSVPQAITLGAIATATAPAATLMVVRQYKAKGPMTNLLLLVVALDDAVGLIVFAASFGAAKSMLTGGADLLAIILNPLIEIVASLALGALMGGVLTLAEKIFHSNTNRLTLSIIFVLLTVALSKLEFPLSSLKLSFSPLLVCMMLGTVFCNVCLLSSDLMERADRWTAPLFTLFFVISGAELNVAANGAVLLVGAVYIVARSLGKYFGAYGSARLMKSSPGIYLNLGITLLPQAGVALGMCREAALLGAQGDLVRDVILFSVLVYELVGPPLTKRALMAAGEIVPQSAEVRGRRTAKIAAAKAEKEHI